MPWSSSPRFSKGSTMYGLLTSQVFHGDGSVSAHVALADRPERDDGGEPEHGQQHEPGDAID